MSETIYDDKDSGLRQAAKELNDAREAGTPISGPEPAPKEPMTPEPLPMRWGNPDDAIPADPDREPIIKHTDRGIDPRDAATKLAGVRRYIADEQKQISEGDEELKRALGEWSDQPPDDAKVRELLEQDEGLRDRVLEFVQRQETADAERERLLAEAQSELDRIKADREQKICEIEERKQREEASTFREQQLAQLAQAASTDQVRMAQKTYLEQMAQAYPECITNEGAWELSQKNPERYARYRADFERANQHIKSIAFDAQQAGQYISQQQQQAFNQYAADQDQAWHDAHPEFHGERGAKAHARLGAAAIEALQEMGYSREQITAAYNSDPQFRSRAGQEAMTALGRQHLAQKSLKEGRRNIAPKVQRPGTASLPGERASQGEIAKSCQATQPQRQVKGAARFLAASRRART